MTFIIGFTLFLSIGVSITNINDYIQRERERERVIRLSPEERERERCVITIALTGKKVGQ